jgi:hypothetical protein
MTEYTHIITATADAAPLAHSGFMLEVRAWSCGGAFAFAY